ncbi:MAG: MFS transporter, partial [Gemmataceae bacterium]
SSALVSDYFPPPERPRFLGLQAMFMSLGGVIFIPIGGLLSQFGWHAPFWVYVLALPVLALAFRTIPEPPRNQANRSANDPNSKIRTRWPWGTIVFLCSVGFLGMIAFYLGPLQVSFHMKEHFGASPLLASLALAAATLTAALTSSQYGKIAPRVRPLVLLVITFGFVGAGFVVVGLTGSEVITWLGLVGTGFGSGLLVPTLSTWMLRAAPPAARGRLSGILISCIFLGQTVSPLILGALLPWRGSHGAFLACGAGCLLLACGGLLADRFQSRK